VRFPGIIHYVEYIVVGMVVIAFLPISIALLRRGLKLRKENRLHKTL